MKSYNQLLSEVGKVTVYHGNRFGTTKINPAHMSTSINEHGVGIYFTDNIETAKTYGNNIVKAEVSMSDFIKSTDGVSKLGRSFTNMMKYLYKLDPEGIWYLITDYGFELFNPEDVKDNHIEELTRRVATEQIRHMQQTLVDSTSVLNFAKAWNYAIKYKGVYQKQQTGETFYVIVDPSIRLEKI